MQEDIDILECFRVIEEYLQAMRMLLAYDVDNVEECLSGFEQFLDQTLAFFIDTFKQWPNESDIQLSIINIVRTGF